MFTSCLSAKTWWASCILVKFTAQWLSVVLFCTSAPNRPTFPICSMNTISAPPSRMATSKVPFQPFVICVLCPRKSAWPWVKPPNGSCRNGSAKKSSARGSAIISNKRSKAAKSVHLQPALSKHRNEFFHDHGDRQRQCPQGHDVERKHDLLEPREHL